MGDVDTDGRIKDAVDATAAAAKKMGKSVIDAADKGLDFVGAKIDGMADAVSAMGRRDEIKKEMDARKEAAAPVIKELQRKRQKLTTKLNADLALGKPRLTADERSDLRDAISEIDFEITRAASPLEPPDEYRWSADGESTAVKISSD
jgi:hypothetical protein